MDYLPFYITYDEFLSYKRKQKKDIESARDVISWSKHDFDAPNRYGKLIAFFIIEALLLVGFSFLFYQEPDLLSFAVCFPSFLFLSFGNYAILGVEKKFEYTLSSKGIILKTYRNQPKWVNIVIGVLVILFILVAFGLFLVYVNESILSGLFGLYIFYLTIKVSLAFIVEILEKENQKNDEKAFFTQTWNSPNHISPSEQWLYAKYHLKRKVINLHTKFDECQGKYEKQGEVWDYAKNCFIRTQSFTSFNIFFKTEKDLLETIEFMKNKSNLICEEVQNKKLIFDEDNEPDMILDLPILRDTYYIQMIGKLRKNPKYETTTIRKRRENIIELKD